MDGIFTSVASAEFGSSASLASGAHIVYAYAVIDCHKGKQSDAPKADTQCPGCKEQDTWFSPDPDQCLESWKGMTDLVCPLGWALYGHYLASTCWEHVCAHAAVNKSGFLPMSGWE